MKMANMKMANMKMAKADTKDMPCVAGSSDAPSYPYGLCLRLDNASLAKLGIGALPKVGAKMRISAMGVITSVSQHESKNRDDRNVEIQIQELAVENQEPPTAAERRESARSNFNGLLEMEKKGRTR